MEPGGSRPAQVAQRLAHDIRRAGELSSPEGCGLHDLACDLVLGCVDELHLDGVRNMLKHDEIAEPLEQVGSEPARLMPGLHDPVDDHE